MSNLFYTSKVKVFLLFDGSITVNMVPNCSQSCFTKKNEITKLKYMDIFVTFRSKFP